VPISSVVISESNVYVFPTTLSVFVFKLSPFRKYFKAIFLNDNNRINEITDNLTRAEVKKIKNAAKQDLKLGKITKAEYRQRISNINRDNIRNKVSSKSERMALD
jgi:hypothetical protein